MPIKPSRFAQLLVGESSLPYRLFHRSAAFMAIAFAVPLVFALSAHAQDAGDERRCTGQTRATNEERIASCTALIDSGRFQAPNLAILHHNRGIAMRAKGDLAGAQTEFTEAIKLNPEYGRAYADRGGVRFSQHDLDGAIEDLDAAIKLDATDAGAFMMRGNVFDEKADFDRAIADYNEAIRLVAELCRRLFQSRSRLPSQARLRSCDRRL